MGAKGKGSKEAAASELADCWLQTMPAGRVRIDPAIREAIAVWLIAAAAPYEREARQSERGLKGAERIAFQKRRDYYRHAVKVIGELIAGLCGTLPREAVETALSEVRSAVSLFSVLPAPLYSADEPEITSPDTAAE